MSDREESTDSQENGWYDSDAGSVDSSAHPESPMHPKHRLLGSPPPSDFVVNFKKCMKLFRIGSSSHQYRRHRREQTKSLSRSPRFRRGFECSSLRRHLFDVRTPEIGAGDMASNVDQKEVIDSKKKIALNCIECGKSYSKSQYVRDHIRTVHHKSRANYSCRVCGQTFSWKVTVLKHIKRRHPEKNNTTHMIDILY